jgi:hypothetical protein
VEVSGEFVFGYFALAAGIVADQDARRHLNYQSGVVHLRRYIYVVDLHFGQAYLGPAGDQCPNTINESAEATAARAIGADIELMRDPVGATGAGDGRPAILRGIPDEAVLRIDVLGNARARGEYALLAGSAIGAAADLDDGVTAGMINALR